MDRCQLYSSNSWDLLQFSVLMILSRSFERFEKSSTHIAFMGYFYSFIFTRVFVLFSKLGLSLAWHTDILLILPDFQPCLDVVCSTYFQPGSDVNPGPLLRQWCARHCGIAALCQQRQLRGGEALSAVEMCPVSGVHFITWDSISWLKDDSPRTIRIWSSDLLELNRTGAEWNWKLVGTSAKGCSNSTRTWYCFGGVF